MNLPIGISILSVSVAIISFIHSNTGLKNAVDTQAALESHLKRDLYKTVPDREEGDVTEKQKALFVKYRLATENSEFWATLGRLGAYAMFFNTVVVASSFGVFYGWLMTSVLHIDSNSNVMVVSLLLVLCFAIMGGLSYSVGRGTRCMSRRSQRKAAKKFDQEGYGESALFNSLVSDSEVKVLKRIESRLNSIGGLTEEMTIVRSDVVSVERLHASSSSVQKTPRGRQQRQENKRRRCWIRRSR